MASADESTKVAMKADIIFEDMVNNGLVFEEERFQDFDLNQSGHIELDDVESLLNSYGYAQDKVHRNVKEQILLRFGKVKGKSQVSKQEFMQACDKMRSRSALIPGLNILSTLLNLFNAIDQDVCSVDYLCTLSAETISKILQNGTHLLTERIMQNLSFLKEKNSPVLSVDEVNAKYTIAAGDEGKMSFGNLSLYEGGLDAYIGLPSTKIVWAVVHEHCQSDDSLIPFKKQNGKETTPDAEFEFVAGNTDDIVFLKKNFPVEAKELELLWNRSNRRQWPELSKPDQTRVRHSLARLWNENLDRIRSVNLRLVELIALISYTGPMYDKYNTSLRKYPKEKFDALQGNRYTSTIHTIASGLIKLAKVEKVPSNRKVYRGLGGKVLPDQFWKPDTRGCCGGVELGCMSTTSLVDVALQYSDAKVSSVKQGRPTIFEIEIGEVDGGAPMRWCSQFPHEEEILFGPLCHLERLGRARVEVLRGSPVLVVPLRVSVNRRSLDLEQLQGRRKMLHLEAMKQITLEAELEMRHLSSPTPSAAPATTTTAAAGRPSRDSNLDQAVRGARARLAAERAAVGARDPDWFNADDNYSCALADSLRLKQAVLNSCALELRKAKLLASPAARAREDALAKRAQQAPSAEERRWLQRQSVAAAMGRAFPSPGSAPGPGQLDLSDPLRAARAVAALDALAEALEDRNLPGHDSDDVMLSPEAVMSFGKKHAKGLEAKAWLGRALETLDTTYGPLPCPVDPDRYFREVMCCYKRALGQPTARRSVMRCLELFEAGTAADAPGRELPARDAWEARLLARFCAGPDLIGQFKVREILTAELPVVELAGGVTEEEAEFLAELVVNGCKPGREVHVLVRGVSVPELPLRLRAGGGANILSRQQTGDGWVGKSGDGDGPAAGLGRGRGRDVARGGKGIGGGGDDVAGTLDLSSMHFGIDALRVAVAAAAAGGGKRATAGMTEAASDERAPPRVRELLLTSNMEIGDAPSANETMDLVVRLAEALGCERLFLTACRLRDAHATALAAAVGDPARLLRLKTLGLVVNDGLGAAAKKGLTAAWRARGLGSEQLIFEIDTEKFGRTLLAGGRPTPRG